MESRTKTFLCALPVIIFFGIVCWAIATSDWDDDGEYKSTGIDKFKSKSHEDMNSSELSLIAVQYDYKDLLRNIDDYSGKIIFVEGVVTNVQRDIGLLNLCVDGATVSFYCDEFMFVVANGDKTWLEEDNLAGYVEVIDLGEVFHSGVLTGGEWVGSGDYVPRVNEIRLICDNC